MAVYVDTMQAKYGRMVMCHMVADRVIELIQMADTIGVQRKWFQRYSHPHFDISLAKKKLAIENGAILVDRRELVAVMHRYRALLTNNKLERLTLARVARKHGC